MSSQTTTAPQEFEDLASRQQMWSSFTKWGVRCTVATVIVLLFIGFITGTL